MQRPIRFGVVGTSYWAQEIHVRGLQARSDIELVGVWGRNSDATGRVAATAGIRAFSSFSALLTEVDAVSIAVAPQAQPALAIESAQAGKHLLLEKPLARSVAEAQSIVDAISRGGTASVVFFTRRFVPPIEHAISLAATRRWSTAFVRIHASVLVTATPYAHSPWRQADGAELWDVGPHALSVLFPVLGPVLRVEAERRSAGLTRFWSEHERGATAEVSLTLRAPPGDARIEFRFADGSESVTLPEPQIDRVATLSAAAGELVQNIVAGRTRHRCDAVFALEGVRVLEEVSRGM